LSDLLNVDDPFDRRWFILFAVRTKRRRKEEEKEEEKRNKKESRQRIEISRKSKRDGDDAMMRKGDLQSMRQRERERERGGGEGERRKEKDDEGESCGKRVKTISLAPILSQHTSEDRRRRRGGYPLLSRGGKRRLLEMSLHEYIDIPLEGFLFTILPPPSSLLPPIASAPFRLVTLCLYLPLDCLKSGWKPALAFG